MALCSLPAYNPPRNRAGAGQQILCRDETNADISRRPQLEHILGSWKDGLGSGERRLAVVRGGLSGAAVWCVETPDGMYCLRGWPRSYADSGPIAEIHRLIRWIGDAAVPLVPVPLSTVHESTLVDWQGQWWELAPWMPGVAAAPGQLCEEQLSSAAIALARVHCAAATFRAAGAPPLQGTSPGLERRQVMVQELQAGGLEQLQRSVQRHAPGDETARLLKILDYAGECVVQVEDLLRRLVDCPLPLQWCLRDVHREHVLFSGRRVTGIVDFGAAAVDSVAGDLARFLGSVGGDAAKQWNLAVAAYETVRPLSLAERKAIAAFDAGGLLGAAANWCRWLCVEQKDFAERKQVLEKLDELRIRLQALAARGGASVAQSISGA